MPTSPQLSSLPWKTLIDSLRAGEQVDFGDLGKFRLQITSHGAETAEKFTSSNITGVNIQFIPGEDLKTIFSGLEFSPVPTRAATRLLLKAQKAGQTTVDFSKTPSSGGNSGSKPDDGGNTGGGEYVGNVLAVAGQRGEQAACSEVVGEMLH